MLERQKSNREDMFQHARRLSMQQRANTNHTAGRSGAPMREDASSLEIESEEDREMGKEVKARANKNKKQEKKDRAQDRALYYAKQFMHPLMLTSASMPPDLATNWLIIPRPEGNRMLMVASGGQTTVRDKSGILIETFPSALPGGSR